MIRIETEQNVHIKYCLMGQLLVQYYLFIHCALYEPITYGLFIHAQQYLYVYPVLC